MKKKLNVAKEKGKRSECVNALPVVAYLLKLTIMTYDQNFQNLSEEW